MNRWRVAVVDRHVSGCIRKLPDPPLTIAIIGSEPPTLANIDRRVVKAVQLEPNAGETFSIFVEAVNPKVGNNRRPALQLSRPRAGVLNIGGPSVDDRLTRAQEGSAPAHGACLKRSRIASLIVSAGFVME